MPSPTPLSWDIFCRVIDNHGDVGVCWRLARQLAEAGDTVRLVLDDTSALTWMAPEAERHTLNVQVLRWPGPADAAQVVVEAFGCDPPAAYVQAMRAADPVWINLEYLSAEAYVERSHGLPSPRADGLRKWFFYPGFTPPTGGLLREPDLMQRRAHFSRDAWLATLGLRRHEGERVVSLFCYDNEALPALLDDLAREPTLLLLTPGPAQRQVPAMLNAQPGTDRPLGAPGSLRTAALPWLSQTDFDHLLWSADLNCVRGEDSLVRALWAGAPFLWQLYPQHDGAHAAKLRALLQRLDLPPPVQAAQRAWNGLAPWTGLPAAEPWRAAVERARSALQHQPDLVTQLRRFVAGRLRALGC